MKSLFGFLVLLCALSLGACGNSKKNSDSPQTDAFVNFVLQLAATAPEDSDPVNTEPVPTQSETAAPINL